MKWLPLPKIAYGVAIYPFSPSNLQQQLSNNNNTSNTRPSSTVGLSQNDDASILTNMSSTSSLIEHLQTQQQQQQQQSSTQPEDYSHFISLEVGDELFIIEQQGQWYRGYVLSVLEEGRKPNKAPIGCFPRTHVQIKEYIDLDQDENDHQPQSHRRRKVSNPSLKPELPSSLLRSFSESHIQSNLSHDHPPHSPRPGSFGDLNLDFEVGDLFINKNSLNHIPPPPLPLSRFEQSTVIGSSEPLVDEIAACVSEWNSLLYKYISERKYQTFNTVRDYINWLFQARRQLLDQALSREELVRLRKEIVQKMVSCNMELHQEIIIRHPEKGYLLDTSNTSLSNIYRMHWKYATQSKTITSTLDNTLLENSKTITASNTSSSINTIVSSNSSSGSLSSPPTTTNSSNLSSTSQLSPSTSHLKGAKFHHLFFEQKACVAHICQPGEFTELYFSLYSLVERKFITEPFVVILTFNGMPKDETQIGKIQALFVDLSSHDMTDSLYLVCHLVRLGGMKMTENKDGFVNSSQFFNHSTKNQASHPRLPITPTHSNNTNSHSNMCRRPFGCAVLSLSSLALQHHDHDTGLVEYDMPIFTATSESNYATLHEDIILDHTKEFTKHPRAESLCVALRPYYGFLDEVLKTNAALLQDTPHTLRLGFADVAFPNESRNELYIKLQSGDLSHYGRSRNIQVSMCVRDNVTGEVIENAIALGAGAKPVSYWESMVIYHEQKPKWCETIKIQMADLKQWERSHVFLTVKHRSSNAAPILKFGHDPGVSTHSGGSEKIVAMGFLPLFLPPFHRDFIADGAHSVCLYKYDKQSSSPRFYLDTVPWCSKSTAPSNMFQQSDTASLKSVKPRFQHQHTPSNHSFVSSQSNHSVLHELSTVSSQNQSSVRLVSMRDSITLTTFLCSTKFTQNKTLVKLLNWRALLEGSDEGTSELLSVLDQFTFVGEVEVVKFLNDIFDALLDIMAYQGDEDELVSREINDQVMAAIIWLLGIVQDRRFSNFRPVLDVYIDRRFQPSRQEGPEMTFGYLIKSLTRLCENPSEGSKAKLLRSSMKVWDYLFRFIVRSRLSQQQKEQEPDRSQNDSLFRQDIDKLLTAIISVMNPGHPNSMIGTQTLALQHFADILAELQKIFTPQQVVDITISFVDACSHVTGRLVGFRLAMILSIVKGPVFEDSVCRPELSKQVFRWIRLWLNSYMSTAKDVIFARKLEQQQQSFVESPSPQQTRLPRAQWIENLRLSLTIMSELLDKVRKSVGMTSSGLTSSCISSPSVSNYSRPASFSATVEDENAQESHDYAQSDLGSIIDEALQLVPQLLNAYKDLQRLTIQALHVSSSSGNNNNNNNNNNNHNNGSNLRQSRQSLSLLRERGGSISGGTNKNPGIATELVQEAQNNQHTKPSTVSSGINSSSISGVSSGAGTISSTSGISGNSKSKFTDVLQALSTSPTTPFPSSYPFQPSGSPAPSINANFTSDHAAMISTGLLDLTVVFLELFYLTPKAQWSSYVRKMYEQDGLEMTAEFLRKIVFTCMGILFGDNILTLEESSLTVDHMGHGGEEDELSERRKLPGMWLNLNTIAYQIVLCDILDPIKSIFELQAFMPSTKAYISPEDQLDNEDQILEDDEEEEEEEEDEEDQEPVPTISGSATPFSGPNTPQFQAHRNPRVKSIEEQRSALLLWRVYFVGFLRVISSPALDVSEFRAQTQRAVWKIIGNMRGEVGAKTFLYLWNLADRSGPALNIHNHSGPEFEETHHRPSTHQTTDYFSIDLHSPASDYNFLPDNTFRKSMVSIEEVDDSNDFKLNPSFTLNQTTPAANNYRHSVRIGPTDELPLSSIYEENQKVARTDVPFLQVDLAYFILSPMCAASLTLHNRVRRNALSVIADIIAIELYSYGELVYVQHTLIGALDRLIMYDNKGDEEVATRVTRELIQLLDQRLQKDNRNDLHLTAKRVVESLGKFINLLLQIKSLPSDDDEYMDERITSTLRLMKFIQVIEREEIYIKYVHQLVQLHLGSKNFIEAALTLRFHSDLLEWDPSDKIAAIPELSFPIQSSFARKESLYMTMLKYLDQGSAWEICIQICKELAYEYEHTLYDYSKLSEILQRQSMFVDNISKKERCFTEYFRVGFYGRGFPASNRNRQYIYRGLEWEKMSSFIERMQNRHPNAQLLPSKIANSVSITDEQLKELNSTLDGQYLQITPVTPIPDTDMIPCLSNPNTPESIKKYYSFNNVNKFSFSRPVTKEVDKSSEASKQPESDFLNLWTEKIEFECEDKFPTIVRRSKIITAQASVISPIENAVTAVENKNKELESLEKKYAVHLPKGNRRSSGLAQPININPFSMSLNGAVDAPVNGGIPLYKKAFLSKEYWEKNPDMRQWIHRLQSAIENQVLIIQKCLETHNKLVSAEMRPFHTTLMEFFNKNFADEIKSMKERSLQDQNKEKTPLTITTSSTNRRRSTLSSVTDTNSVYSHQFQQIYDDSKLSIHSISRQSTCTLVQTPGVGGIPVLPTLPVMSPISRAFSLKTPLPDNIPGLTPNNAFENGNMSRTESLSRSLKISLRKKSRKKSLSPSIISANSLQQ